jgi:hypothetical protein
MSPNLVNTLRTQSPFLRSPATWVGTGLFMALLALPLLDRTEPSKLRTAGSAAAAEVMVSSSRGSDATHEYPAQLMDHSVVNQHSTAHESDLPGASIAEYGSGLHN